MPSENELPAYIYMKQGSTNLRILILNLPPLPWYTVYVSGYVRMESLTGVATVTKGAGVE